MFSFSIPYSTLRIHNQKTAACFYLTISLICLNLSESVHRNISVLQRRVISKIDSPRRTAGCCVRENQRLNKISFHLFRNGLCPDSCKSYQCNYFSSLLAFGRCRKEAQEDKNPYLTRVFQYVNIRQCIFHAYV